MEENTQHPHLPLIGDMAPEFKAITTKGKVVFPSDFFGKWIILFSHPTDFTPVCTTEFMILADMQEEFKKINTELLGLSIDSLNSHIAWVRSIQNLEWDNYKKSEIDFPVIADISMNVAKKYGMLHPNAANTQTVRAVFLIDPESKIRAILYYPMNMGRNFDEIKRMIVALQKADKEHVSTPANWVEGEDVILPSPLTLEEAQQAVDKNDNKLYTLDWFLTFKKER